MGIHGGSAPADLASGPTGTARRDAGTARFSLTDLAHNLDGFGVVQFSIDLRDGGRPVAEDDLGSIDAKLSSQKRGRVVTKLVRVPAVFCAPLFASLVTEFFRDWKSLVTGAGDRSTVAIDVVALAWYSLWMCSSIGAL